MNPTGRMNILYQNNSYHNALLLTNLCNCNCIMCPQPKVKHENDMTPLNIKLISLINKKTKQLAITGGEPTLLEDKFFQIISECKHKLPETHIDILSNEIKFKDINFTKEFALLQHPDILVAIPLYSDTDTEHNNIVQAKGFYDTIEGLYNLALFQQKIEIRVVINNLNYKRLPKLAEFIYHNFPFVYHIALMGMETINLAKKNIDTVWVDPYDYRDKLRKAVIYLNQRDMNVSIYNHQLCILPKDLWDYSQKSISTWKNIYLDKCITCQEKDNCGGFFESSLTFHSKYIQPFS
ncbi:MAG: His-Xaa-Ser system radical SAM maturase HxsC [Candidatus Eremiobacterota bacterium]